MQSPPIRTRLRFDGVDFDARELRLTRAGKVIELQPKVSRLLELLAAQPGQLVRKEELIKQLWPDVFVNEEALTQLVRKLRKALDDDARLPRYVQTVTTRGYRFLPEVVTIEVLPAAEEETAAPAIHCHEDRNAPATSTGARPRPSAPGRPALLIAGSVGIAVLLLLGWYLASAPRRQPLRLGNTAVRRLTHTASHKQDLALSPDGRLVVFAANDPAEGQLDLYLLAIAGGTATRLTHTPGDEYAPQFSPDGEHILASRLESGADPSLVLLPGLGGDERVLVTPAMWGCWSPDGQEVAFARQEDHGWAIVRRSVANRSERLVTRVDAPVVSLAWSPDGKELAWTDEVRVLAVAATGGQVRAVGDAASYIRSVRWEPATGALLSDGAWQGRNDLWRLDPRSSRREALTVAGGNLFHPAASADGRRLVYVQEIKEQVILSLDREGRHPQPVPAKTTLRTLALDPSGRWLAFTDDDPWPGGGNVGVMPVDGGQVRALSERSASHPSFSPDGQTIAFIQHDTGGDRVALVAASGGEVHLASTSYGSDFSAPAWSPDGRFLAVTGGFSGLGQGLYLVELASGAVRPLVTGSYSAPAWLPGGDRIAACAHGEGGGGWVAVAVQDATTTSLDFGCSRHSPPPIAAGGSTLLVLAGSRSRPRLCELSLSGGPTGRELPLEFPPEAGFWGIFEVLPRPGGGFLALMERYESDLNLLEPTG